MSAIDSNSLKLLLSMTFAFYLGKNALILGFLIGGPKIVTILQMSFTELKNSYTLAKLCI